MADVKGRARFRVKLDLSSLNINNLKLVWFVVVETVANGQIKDLKEAVFSRFKIESDVVEPDRVEVWLEDSVVPDDTEVSLLEPNDLLIFRIFSDDQSDEVSKATGVSEQSVDVNVCQNIESNSVFEKATAGLQSANEACKNETVAVQIATTVSSSVDEMPSDCKDDPPVTAEVYDEIGLQHIKEEKDYSSENGGENESRETANVTVATSSYKLPYNSLVANTPPTDGTKRKKSQGGSETYQKRKLAGFLLGLKEHGVDVYLPPFLRPEMQYVLERSAKTKAAKVTGFWTSSSGQSAYNAQWKSQIDKASGLTKRPLMDSSYGLRSQDRTYFNVGTTYGSGRSTHPGPDFMSRKKSLFEHYPYTSCLSGSPQSSSGITEKNYVSYYAAGRGSYGSAKSTDSSLTRNSNLVSYKDNEKRYELKNMSDLVSYNIALTHSTLVGKPETPRITQYDTTKNISDNVKVFGLNCNPLNISGLKNNSTYSRSHVNSMSQCVNSSWQFGGPTSTQASSALSGAGPSDVMAKNITVSSPSGKRRRRRKNKNQMAQTVEDGSIRLPEMDAKMPLKGILKKPNLDVMENELNKTTDDLATDKFTLDHEKSYGQYPLLDGPLQIHDVVAFKSNEDNECTNLDSDEYKMGRVVQYDADQNEVLLEITDSVKVDNGTEFPDMDEYTEEVVMDLNSFAEVRLVERAKHIDQG